MELNILTLARIKQEMELTIATEPKHLGRLQLKENGDKVAGFRHLVVFFSVQFLEAVFGGANVMAPS